MYRLPTRCTAWIIDLPQIFGYCPHIFCGICLNLTEKSPSYRSVVWETPDGTSFKTTASTLSDTSTKFSVSFFVFPFTWSSNSPAELSSWRRHRTFSIVVVWEWCYFFLVMYTAWLGVLLPPLHPTETQWSSALDCVMDKISLLFMLMSFRYAYLSHAVRVDSLSLRQYCLDLIYKPCQSNRHFTRPVFCVLLLKIFTFRVPVIIFI